MKESLSIAAGGLHHPLRRFTRVISETEVPILRASQNFGLLKRELCTTEHSVRIKGELMLARCEGKEQSTRRLFEEEWSSRVLMMESSWLEIGLLISNGAIGSLLVWGYQNWLRK